jgi:hypothetical protein
MCLLARSRLLLRHKQLQQGKLTKRSTGGSCSYVFAVPLNTTLAFDIAIKDLLYLTSNSIRVCFNAKRLLVFNRAASNAVGA